MLQKKKESIIVLLLVFVVAVAPDTSKRAMDDFMRWAISEHGSALHGVRLVREKDAGYGFVAERDIEKGETVLEVPEALGLGFRKGELTLTSRSARMAAVLLTEKMLGPASFGRPWLMVLPTEVSPLEVFRPYLEGDALEMVKSAMMEFSQDMENLRRWRNHSAQTAFSDHDAKWALEMCSTRAFKANFLPLVDFLNHHDSGAGLHFDHLTQRYLVRVTQSYHRGEAVHLRYGDLRDEELMVRYRFVSNNPNRLHRWVNVDWTGIGVAEEYMTYGLLRELIEAEGPCRLYPEGKFAAHCLPVVRAALVTGTSPGGASSEARGRIRRILHGRRPLEDKASEEQVHEVIITFLRNRLRTLTSLDQDLVRFRLCCTDSHTGHVCGPGQAFECQALWLRIAEKGLLVQGKEALRRSARALGEL